jgi:hypothetical protein
MNKPPEVPSIIRGDEIRAIFLIVDIMRETEYVRFSGFEEAYDFITNYVRNKERPFNFLGL